MTLVPALRRVRLARRRLAADATQRPAAAPPAPATGGPDEKPRLRDWIGVLAMCAGLVMAIMDVQIVTSSLTQIQGGLSASSDEIAWVQTAYLIADVVMVPLSGMMTRLLSTRIVFVVAALGFTGASALCATATSLGQMILYRALQGFCGGAAIAGHADGHHFDALQYFRDHPSDHWRLSTDTFSWHWMFLVRHRQARFFAPARFRRYRTGADGNLSRLPRNTPSRRGRAGIGSMRRRSAPRSSSPP